MMTVGTWIAFGSLFLAILADVVAVTVVISRNTSAINALNESLKTVTDDVKELSHTTADHSTEIARLKDEDKRQNERLKNLENNI